MFITVMGIGGKPVMVNLDTVTHIRPVNDSGTKIYTLNGPVDAQDSFDKLSDLIMSDTKGASHE